MSELIMRRSQIITPFGPGSIVEQKGGSFCVTTSDVWNADGGEDIYDHRLQKKLNKTHFKTPAPHTRFKKITPFAKMTRFPRWHFCKRCRKMLHLKRPAQKLLHEECNAELVPMRFIMICEHGHMSDVPWERWVHADKRCEGFSLSFLSDRTSGGLESLKIKCNKCNKVRTLKGILSKNSLASAAAKCSGSQPWDSDYNYGCDKKPLVVQKGASNVIFPILISSIDIPPYSKSAFRNQTDLKVKGDESYRLIRVFAQTHSIDNLFSNQFLMESLVPQICEKYSINEEELKIILSDDLGKKKNEETSNSGVTLKEEEYQTFCNSNISFAHDDYLIFKNMRSEIEQYKKEISDPKLKTVIAEVSSVIDRVVKVDKLRIVTVYKGFCRQSLPKLDIFEDDRFDPQQEKDIKSVPADRGAERTWLPAVENFGEGIFFTLNENRLNAFIESDKKFVSRAKKLDITPKFLLLHTLSHLFIRQLAFECGYPAASIAERIYCEDESKNDKQKMAGVLIYTYGDSHGSLGGLAGQAEPHRFFPLFYNGVNAISWCSNDPLCSESEGQGLMNSNLAACHSCVLLPETSCEIFNRFLDRVLLIGSEEQRINGLFQNLINL
jgi:hypothetical protein